MEYYTAIKKQNTDTCKKVNECHRYAEQRSQSLYHPYCVIPFIES